MQARARLCSAALLEGEERRRREKEERRRREKEKGKRKKEKKEKGERKERGKKEKEGGASAELAATVVSACCGVQPVGDCTRKKRKETERRDGNWY